MKRVMHSNGLKSFMADPVHHKILEQREMRVLFDQRFSYASFSLIFYLFKNLKLSMSTERKNDYPSDLLLTVTNNLCGLVTREKKEEEDIKSAQ